MGLFSLHRHSCRWVVPGRRPFSSASHAASYTSHRVPVVVLRSVLIDTDASTSKSTQENVAELERYAEQAGLDPRWMLRLAALQPRLAELPAATLYNRLDTISSILDTSLQVACQLVGKFPDVLDIPPDALRESCALLAKALNLTPKQLQSVLAARPALLTDGRSEIAAFDQACTQLSVVLQVPRASAVEMLARLAPAEFTEVTTLSPAELRGRLQELCGLLAVNAASRGQEGTTGAQAQLAVLLMVMKTPSLLALSTERVMQSLDTLAYVFHGPLRHFAGVLSRRPLLLAIPPSDLRTNFDALMALLSVGHHRCSRLCFMEPRLLLLSPAVLGQRLNTLQHLLYLDRQQAANVVVRQPFVLQYRSSYLHTKLEALMSAMGVSPEVVAGMVIRRPRLLLTSTPKMLAVLDTLAHILQVPRGSVVRMLQAQPVLLTNSLEKTEANFRGHLELLGVAAKSWARQISSYPILLTISASSLNETVDDLASLLGLPPQQVVSMAVRNAGFLCVPIRQCKSNYDTVLARLTVDPELLAEAVAGAPFILTMQPQRLESHCSSLSRLLSSSPLWRSQWSALLPTELSALLGLSRQQMEHMQFVVKRGKQAEMSLFDSCLLDRSRFSRRFPSFRTAASWKSEGQGARVLRALTPAGPTHQQGSDANTTARDSRQATAPQEAAADKDGAGRQLEEREMENMGEEQSLRSIPVTQKIPEGARKSGMKWIGRGMKSQEIF